MTASGPIRRDREVALAKVNLFLHVLGRKPDGYHRLESLAVFPKVGDLVEVETAAKIDLTVSGPFGLELAGASNIAVDAANALSAKTPGAPGAAIRLTKSLPVAAGIGGGSADAGATLRVLSRFWSGAPAVALEPIAAALGADAPVCLHSRPALMTGIGETLTPPPAFPGFWMVLVNPRQPLSTAEVFGALESRENAPAAPAPDAFIDFGHLISWLASQRNDLEAPALRMCPIIGQTLRALNRSGACRLARMSGSGATCFGLFARGDEALPTAEHIRRSEPGWWVAAAPVDAWSGA